MGIGDWGLGIGSYVILYFLTKKLPWQGITAKTQDKRYKKIYEKKNELEKWEKFKTIPEQIQNFVKYCRNLGFTQDPDYKLMKNYFYDLLDKLNLEVDNNFSWIIDKSIIGSKMPELFSRKKYSRMYKFMDQIEKKKLSLSVGNTIKYQFNFNNNKNNSEKRNNSPINKETNKIDASNDDEDSNENNSSINGVQQYKLGEFDDNEEENE